MIWWMGQKNQSERIQWREQKGANKEIDTTTITTSTESNPTEKRTRTSNINESTDLKTLCEIDCV